MYIKMIINICLILMISITQLPSSQANHKEHKETKETDMPLSNDINTPETSKLDSSQKEHKQTKETDMPLLNDINTPEGSEKEPSVPNDGRETVSVDSSEEHCEELSEEEKEMIKKQKEFDELKEWADNIPVLKEEDAKLVKQLNDFVKKQKSKALPDSDVVDQFYRVMAMPLQLPCTVLKPVGESTWYDSCGSWEGETSACLDNIHWDSVNDQCIVYSFGMSHKMSFEKDMARANCTVRLYDPHEDLEPNPSKYVFFKKEGLAHRNGKMALRLHQNASKLHRKNLLSKATMPVKLTKPLPVKTLSEFLKENGEQDKEISYIRMDIEGEELEAIPEMVKSGSLKNVRQLGIQLHTGSMTMKKKERPPVLRKLLRAWKQLNDMGLQHISYIPNRCVGKSQDPVDRRYYATIDVVLYKNYSKKEKAYQKSVLSPY